MQQARQLIVIVILGACIILGACGGPIDHPIKEYKALTDSLNRVVEETWVDESTDNAGKFKKTYLYNKDGLLIEERLYAIDEDAIAYSTSGKPPVVITAYLYDNGRLHMEVRKSPVVDRSGKVSFEEFYKYDHLNGVELPKSNVEVNDYDKSTFVGHWSFDIAENTNFVINDSLGVFYFEDYDHVGTVLLNSPDSMLFVFEDDIIRYRIVHLSNDSMVVETMFGQEVLRKK